MTFAVFEFEYLDQTDELVLTERLTVIETSDQTGGKRMTDPDSAGPNPDATGPDPDTISVGDVGPKVVFEDVQHEDFVRYAGASGDFNPVHYDKPYAKAAGYPSVFGQGMFTAGIASRAATD